MTTTTIRIQASRPQDYLTDPLYTVSCYKDHIKAWSSSQHVRAVILPIYPNMFSTVGNHPSQAVQIRVAHMDPHIGQNRYVAIDEHPRVAGANRYKYFRKPLIPYTDNPGGTLVLMKQPASTIMTPQSNGMPMTADEEQMLMQQQQQQRMGGMQGGPVSIGIQTLYRESEAQTDPYSPAYVLSPTAASASTQPEILALAHLTHRAGLPAGVAEIEMIERARAKREWERSLPPVTDDASFAKRLEMMEAMELAEWEEREKEIARLQARRMSVLRDALDARTREHDAQGAARMHAIWQRKLVEKDEFRAKMDARRAKEMRKLQEKRRVLVEGVTRSAATAAAAGNPSSNRASRRDIIADYASLTSSVYLPKPRDGIPTHTQSVMDVLLAKRPSVLSMASAAASAAAAGDSTAAFASAAANTGSSTAAANATALGIASVALPPPPLSALEHLESLFPASVVHPSMAAPSIISATAAQGTTHLTPAARREAANLAQLEAMDNQLRAQKSRDAAPPLPPPRYLRPVPKPVPRAPTPAAAAEDPEEDARHQRALLVQRWLRGRMVQANVLDGANRRRELIAELRLEMEARREEATEIAERQRLELLSAGGGGPGAVSGTVGSLLQTTTAAPPTVSGERRRGPAALVGPVPETPQSRATDAALDNVISPLVGQQLDYLDKEIARLQDQRTLAAQAKLAERARRMREAQEAGVRQRELATRAREDAVWRTVMRVHQGTVETLMAGVVEGGVADAAELRARELVRQATDTSAENATGVSQDLIKTAIQEQAEEGSEEDQETQGMVASLVSSFLFPEAERRMVREQVARAQMRHLVAAHRSIVGSLANVTREVVAGGDESEDVPIDTEVLASLTSDLGDPSMSHGTELTGSEADLAAKVDPRLSTPIAMPIKRRPMFLQEAPGDQSDMLELADVTAAAARVPLPESRPQSTWPDSRPSSSHSSRPQSGKAVASATPRPGSAAPRPGSSRVSSGRRATPGASWYSRGNWEEGETRQLAMGPHFRSNWHGPHPLTFSWARSVPSHMQGRAKDCDPTLTRVALKFLFPHQSTFDPTQSIFEKWASPSKSKTPIPSMPRCMSPSRASTPSWPSSRPSRCP
ncbi:solute carrier, TRAMD3 or PAT1-domain-containing protein [Blastocladiella britannica]|nr:solute carrier, TRAMD3 or PAT1-domain-containing protein [Blastocladiella britannica]